VRGDGEAGVGPEAAVAARAETGAEVGVGRGTEMVQRGREMERRERMLRWSEAEAVLDRKFDESLLGY
jgi:hypothetical protein